MTEEVADTSMTSTSGVSKVNKSHDLVTSIIKAPPYSYAHLQVFGDAHPDAMGELDAIQVRSYCTSALKQFLGATGIAISLDILKVQGDSCWLRLPRDDLGAFSAAITTWQGTSQNGVHSSLRIRGCSDWLGALVGQEGEQRLWSG